MGDVQDDGLDPYAQEGAGDNYGDYSYLEDASYGGALDDLGGGDDGAGATAAGDDGNEAVPMSGISKNQQPLNILDPNKSDSGKMFIGGLNWETTDESMRAYFEKFGEVDDCVVMKDPATNRSRGFGFLTFRDSRSVDEVLQLEHTLDGKIIDPKRAIPREEQERTEKIFVGGVAADVTEDNFRDYFTRFGKVVDATLMTDRETGRPRGFGFITFENSDGVDKAMAKQSLGELEINGKTVEVKRAMPKHRIQSTSSASYGRGGTSSNSGFGGMVDTRTSNFGPIRSRLGGASGGGGPADTRSGGGRYGPYAMNPAYAARFAGGAGGSSSSGGGEDRFGGGGGGRFQAYGYPVGAYGAAGYYPMEGYGSYGSRAAAAGYDPAALAAYAGAYGRYGSYYGAYGMYPGYGGRYGSYYGYGGREGYRRGGAGGERGGGGGGGYDRSPGRGGAGRGAEDDGLDAGGGDERGGGGAPPRPGPGARGGVAGGGGGGGGRSRGYHPYAR
ncbi:hypothetical protein HDV00_001808 [Rhizophlyctis rosea]|nr:hypothetical protein HDV00_001808 [Rhizophlyctis rosea]